MVYNNFLFIVPFLLYQLPFSSFPSSNAFLLSVHIVRVFSVSVSVFSVLLSVSFSPVY